MSTASLDITAMNIINELNDGLKSIRKYPIKIKGKEYLIIIGINNINNIILQIKNKSKDIMLNDYKLEMSLEELKEKCKIYKTYNDIESAYNSIKNIIKTNSYKIKKITDKFVDMEMKIKFMDSYFMLKLTLEVNYINPNELIEKLRKQVINLTKQNNYLINELKKYTNEVISFEKIIDTPKTIYYNITETERYTKLFDESFVNNNKNSCYLLINNIKNDLCPFYLFPKKSIFEIKIIELNPIINMSKMFANCHNIHSLESLKYWDMSLVENTSFMFSSCVTITNIDSLKDWDTTNINNMYGMFYGCTSLTSIEPIRNWNISSLNDISYMFSSCISITSLEPMNDWDISNIEKKEQIFSDCNQIALKSTPLKFK